MNWQENWRNESLTREMKMMAVALHDQEMASAIDWLRQSDPDGVIEFAKRISEFIANGDGEIKTYELKPLFLLARFALLSLIAGGALDREPKEVT